jgi:hypothetical protein
MNEPLPTRLLKPAPSLALVVRHSTKLYALVTFVRESAVAALW